LVSLAWVGCLGSRPHPSIQSFFPSFYLLTLGSDLIISSIITLLEPMSQLSIVINHMIEDMETFRADMDEFYDENIDEWDAFFEQYEIYD
jgi:hypothetical protein